jgi:hypothetical protein
MHPDRQKLNHPVRAWLGTTHLEILKEFAEERRIRSLGQALRLVAEAKLEEIAAEKAVKKAEKEAPRG